MPLRVSGRNINIGTALQQRIIERVEEAMSKYFRGGYSGHATVGKDGFGFRTECVLHLDSGALLEAEGMAADAYESADQAAIHIEKRLRRYKRRRKDHQAASRRLNPRNAIKSGSRCPASPIDAAADRPYGPPPSTSLAIRRCLLRSLAMSMTLTDLVAPNAIIPALKVNNKKQAIQELAARAAELTGQNERAILEILLQREKLGSTAVGNGVAIPHGKLPKLGRLFGLFARLERAIDFEALDGQPVDLIFLLLAPEAAGADHLKALARVARLLRDPEIARKLRELARCRRALCRAGDAGGEQRGVAAAVTIRERRRSSSLHVLGFIPAPRDYWMPAFAGMTAIS